MWPVAQEQRNSSIWSTYHRIPGGDQSSCLMLPIDLICQLQEGCLKFAAGLCSCVPFGDRALVNYGCVLRGREGAPASFTVSSNGRKQKGERPRLRLEPEPLRFSRETLPQGSWASQTMASISAAAAN